TTTINAGSDANLTGSTVNGLAPASYGLVVNAFSGTQAVVDFNLSSIPSYANINLVELNFDESAEANAPGLVAINGYGRTGAFTAADATAAVTQMGSYSSVTLGLGPHSV